MVEREERIVEVQPTADGSPTLYVPSMDEHYHSVKGALTESLHIFIHMGLQESKAAEPRVLEIGFGTGLNALLTLEEAKKGRVVHYTTLERFPLSQDVIEKLDYASFVSDEMASFYLSLHQAPWNEWVQLTPFFHLRKVEADFTTLEIKEKYDVIYFDAFAPEKQPEMWSQEIFDKIAMEVADGK